MKKDLSQTFGFRQTNPKDRVKRISRVFDEIHDRYDMMNDLLSLGTHRHWKSKMIAAVQPKPNQCIVDLAGGTGDIAARLVGKAERVIIIDPCQNMLQHAQKRLGDAAEYIVAPGEHMPLEDNSVDTLCISFGIRNAESVEAMLAEIFRVLKPGGRFLCLEFSRIAKPIRPLYDLFSYTVIPALATIIAKNSNSYLYLVESIRVFYSQEELAELIAAAGFEKAAFTNYYWGMIALHSGQKPYFPAD